MSRKKARIPKPFRTSAEVKLNPTNPVPREAAGVSYTLMGSARYIPFLGNDDNFVSKLIEARVLSPTRSACVSTKTDYSIAEGVVISNLAEGEIEDPAFEAWRKNCNAEGQTLNDLLRAGFENLWLAGNVPVELVRVKVAGKPFFYAYNHDLQDCRLGKEEGESAASFALVSASFGQSGILQNIDKAKKIPLYKAGRPDSENWVKDGAVERTMIWVKTEMAGYKHYGMTGAVSSMTWQVIEYRGARYNLDNLENNMVVGATLVLQGSHTDAEATKVARKIIHQHTGSGKVGRVAVIASEQEIKDSKFIEHNTQKDASYGKLQKIAESQILISENWDAVLAGLQNESALGKGGNYLKEIYEQKLRTVIKPAQKKIIENLLKPMVAEADAWLGTRWSDYDLAIPAVDIGGAPELATSAEGVRLILEIAKAVKVGDYTYDAAVALVSDRFKVSPAKAMILLGIITVKKQGNVPA